MVGAAVSNSCSVLTTPWVEMIEVERFDVRTVEGYERCLSNFKGDLLLVAYSICISAEHTRPFHLIHACLCVDELLTSFVLFTDALAGWVILYRRKTLWRLVDVRGPSHCRRCGQKCVTTCMLIMHLDAADMS